MDGVMFTFVTFITLGWRGEGVCPRDEVRYYAMPCHHLFIGFGCSVYMCGGSKQVFGKHTEGWTGRQTNRPIVHGNKNTYILNSQSQ